MTDSATSTRPTPLGSYSSSKLFKYHKTGNISPNIQIFFQIFKYHETGNIFPGPDTTRRERNRTTQVFHISAVSPRCLHLSIFIQNQDSCQTGFSLTTSKDGNFNIVFAIKKDYESAYKALARCLQNISFHKIFPARSPGKRTLRCWSRTRRTSSMWWRAATRGSPPPSRWRSSTISDAIPRWKVWGQMKGLDYSS